MLIKVHLSIIDSAVRGGALHMNNYIMKIRLKIKVTKWDLSSDAIEE